MHGYLWDLLNSCDKVAFSHLLTVDGLNVYYLQCECLRLLIILVPSVIFTQFYHCCQRREQDQVIFETPQTNAAQWLMVVFWKAMGSTYINCYIDAWSCLVFGLEFWVSSLYTDISLLWGVNNANFGYLWNPLDCYSMIVNGHFLRARGFKLYHLPYGCLKMLRIWATLLYTWVYRVCKTLTMSSLGISETP